MSDDAGPSNRDEWIIIGISGVTCGGKTTLANRLRTALPPPVHVFHQDRYFYPDESPRHVRCEGLPHNNYDVLSALDMEALHADLAATLAGGGRAHEASAAPPGAAPSPRYLVVEGFTVLNYEPIMEMCDLRYYLTLEYGECMSRRALRLYSPPDVAGYFERVVWPHHLLYRAQIENDKRVTFLDGARGDALEIVLADVRRLNT